MYTDGILFDSIHSYRNLGLILSSADIPPASVKTNYINIPGGDGALDLTEAFGGVRYNSRDCTFYFTVDPSQCESQATFEEKKTKVSNALNGLRCKITLDKDPEYYYFGRCTVDSYGLENGLRKIIVKAYVDPFKYKQKVTTISSAITSTAKTLNLSNGRMPAIPRIKCTATTKIVFGSVTTTLKAGTHKVLDIVLKEGKNNISVSGSGTVTFSYQQGDL